jgi:hypothetical protein
MSIPSSANSLAATQLWFQDAILAEDPPPAASLIKPSHSLEPSERLDIYRNMYRARLEEALRSDYPLLARSLGAELFSELVALYIFSHPSRSYTLNRLGDHLPDFIANIGGLPRPSFHQDLARFEHLQSQVFDADQVEPCATPDLTHHTSDQIAALLFAPIPALRVVTLRYDVLSDVTPARPRRTHFVIYRRNYALLHHKLSAQQLRVLQALLSGQPLGAAAALARPSVLRSALQHWITEGWFSSIEVAA